MSTVFDNNLNVGLQRIYMKLVLIISDVRYINNKNTNDEYYNKFVM